MMMMIDDDCEYFAKDHDILYNTKKSMCMTFYPLVIILILLFHCVAISLTLFAILYTLVICYVLLFLIYLIMRIFVNSTVLCVLDQMFYAVNFQSALSLFVQVLLYEFLL